MSSIKTKVRFALISTDVIGCGIAAGLLVVVLGGTPEFAIGMGVAVVVGGVYGLMDENEKQKPQPSRGRKETRP